MRTQAGELSGVEDVKIETGVRAATARTSAQHRATAEAVAEVADVAGARGRAGNHLGARGGARCPSVRPPRPRALTHAATAPVRALYGTPPSNAAAMQVENGTVALQVCSCRDLVEPAGHTGAREVAREAADVARTCGTAGAACAAVGGACCERAQDATRSLVPRPGPVRLVSLVPRARHAPSGFVFCPRAMAYLCMATTWQCPSPSKRL